MNCSKDQSCMTSETETGAAESDLIGCVAAPAFADWLSRAGGALAVTTYQAGKVALIGWDGQEVRVLLRHFPRPMGLAVQGSRLALALRQQLWLFADASQLAGQYLDWPAGGGAAPEPPPGGYDALYLPRVS